MLVLVGCGYQFQGSGSDLPADVKKIYIPIVENRTTKPTLTSLMTEALRDQFERYGVIEVVESIDQAQAVLRIKIVSFDNKSSASSAAGDTSLQEQLTLKAEGELRRPTGAALWANNKLSVSKYIGTASNTVVTSSAEFAGGGLSSSNFSGLQGREISRGQEDQALQVLSEDLAKSVYDDSVTPRF